MLHINPGQYSFDPLHFEEQQNLSPEEGRKAALAARKALKKEIEKDGRYTVSSWTLSNQLRKYRSFGVPCGRVRNVFYLTVTPC